MDTDTRGNTSVDRPSLPRMYMREVFEAFVLILILALISEKQVDVWKFTKIALLVGLITTAVQWYDPGMFSDLRKGMNVSVGSNLLSGI